ncbi:MAG: Ig-like domain-containing protein [Acidobacteriota bacterium]
MLRHLLLLSLAVLLAPTLGAELTLAPDTASTTDDTPVLIDVLANDSGSGGFPMILTAASSSDCPGQVVFERDGTVELRPATVAATTTCRIDYTVQAAGQTRSSTVAMTVTPSGDGGGGPAFLGVPTEPFGGCLFADGTFNREGPAERCCWRELLRALDGQADLDWQTIDVLKVRAVAPNQRLLCRAADYFSRGSASDSKQWFIDDLERQIEQDGWMNAGCTGDGCSNRGHDEVLSPLYGSWHQAAYMTALDRARTENDTTLVPLLEGWLRTYWIVNALTAHDGPLVETTTITQNFSSCGGDRHTITANPGEWNGLSLANAGARRLGNTCQPQGYPLGALVPLTQPGHYTTAMALDWFPRRWTAGNLGCGPETPRDSCSNYHDATRTLLLLEGLDYRADGGVDLESISVAPERFGLTSELRQTLHAFVANPASDRDRLEALVDAVDEVQPWAASNDCPMTFLRTTEGTLSRFGTDPASTGQWLDACNRNKPPIYAAVVDSAGRGQFLSPGNTQLGSTDASERQGNNIAARTPSGTKTLARPGGELLYRVEWTRQNGLKTVANNLPSGGDQLPYLGNPAALPGRLEAEHYDVGGEGVAWSDTTPTNTASFPIRPLDGVDAGDIAGRTAVLDTVAGEWLEYTVDITNAAAADLRLDYRNVGSSPGRVLFQVDGQLNTIVELPPTSGAWQMSAAQTISGLSLGQRVVRLTLLEGGVEVDGLELGPVMAERTPFFGTPQLLASRIEAETFDIGGQDLTWSDTTPELNTGINAFRPTEGVDISELAPERIVITDIAAGEWLEYSVTHPADGVVGLSVEYRSQGADGSVRFEILGTGVSRTLRLPDQGSSWRRAHAFDLPTVPAGEYIVRVTIVEPGFELDSFLMTPLGAERKPYGDGVVRLPGLLEVEHYDLGDPGDAYFDTTPFSIPTTDAFRPDDWVDGLTVPAGTIVSHIDVDEWLEYTVDFGEEGSYPIELRYTADAAGQLRVIVRNAGQDESVTTFDLPATSGWRIETMPEVYAGRGSRVIRLEFSQPTYSLDWIDFGDPTPPEPPEPPTGRLDTIYVPNDAVNFPIPFTSLTENDLPAGLVIAGDSGPGPGYWLSPAPFEGTLVRGATAFYYTAPTNWDGTAEFLYRAEHVLDGFLFDRGQVILRDLGELPIARDDAIEVLPGNDVLIRWSTLFSNDDGASLELDGIASMPSEGTLELRTRSLLYRAPAQPTVDSFAYRLRDSFGNLAPAPATVTITVTDSPTDPVANDDFFYMAERKTSGGFADIDIPFNVVEDNDTASGSAQLAVTTEGDVNCGSLPAAHFLGWTYTTAAGCNDVRWRYRLTDTNSSGYDIATIRVDVVPAPVGGTDERDTIFGQSIDLAAQALLSNDQGFGLGLIFLADTVTQPQPAGSGVVTVAGGTVRFEPAAGFVGDATFTYQVRNDLPERAADYLSGAWDVTSDPVSVVVTVQPPDAVAQDDVAQVRREAGFVDLPFDRLLANDEPAAELDLIEFTDPALGQVSLLFDRLRYTPSPAFWSAGSDTLTYSVRRVGGSGYVSTASVTLEAEAECIGGFADDFEGADLSAWSLPAEDGGTLTLTSAAALAGLQGLRVEVQPGAASVRIGEASIAGSSHPRVSFLFDPSGMSITESAAHPVFAAGDSMLLTSTRIGGVAHVRLIGVVETGIVGTDWIPLADAPHRIGLEMTSASGVGAPDGTLRLWIDDFLRGELTGLANHGAPTKLSSALVGALWTLDGASGHYAFDDYTVCEAAQRRDRLVVDGFEMPDFGAWDAVHEVGGALTIDAASALEGNRGLRVQIDPNAHAVRVGSEVVEGEDHVHASFRIDTSGLVMAEGEAMHVFGLAGPQGWVHHVHLGFAGGAFQVRQAVGLDAAQWSIGPWFELDAAATSHRLTTEWWQASRPGAADGGARLAIDGTTVDDLSALNNASRWIQRVYLGAVAAIDAGTVGVLGLDSAQVWRGDKERRNLVLDDFEGGLSSAWSSAGQGSLVVGAAGALEGTSGLSVDVSSATGAQLALVTAAAADTRHLATTFLFDPASLSMGDGEEVILFGGSRNGWRFNLRLGQAAGQQRLRLVAFDDDSAVRTTPSGDLGGAGIAQRIGVEWWLPTTPGAGDGGARLTIDGVVIGEILALDNDDQAFDDLFLGAMGLGGATASGTFHLDDVQVWSLER